jgi:hypothetical protein
MRVDKLNDASINLLDRPLSLMASARKQRLRGWRLLSGPSCCQYDICPISPAAEELTMKQLTQKDLRAFHACARHCDRSMIILKGKGRVRWMKEPARRCVAEFFGDVPAQANHLPKLLIVSATISTPRK